MIKKTVHFLYVLISSILLIFVVIFYLSEENIRKKNKLRSIGLLNQNNLMNDLPLKNKKKKVKNTTNFLN